MPTKTKVIDPMTTSGSLDSDYCSFVKNHIYNPIVLHKFLNEINASINSKRREWLLECFDSAQVTDSSQIDDHLNFGILLTKCQVTGYTFWTNKIHALERHLAQARADELQHLRTSRTIEVFGLTLYKKLTPAEKIAKQITEAHSQREASVTTAHTYLAILEDIFTQGKLPSDYKEKSLTVSDFILNLLMPKNGVSIMHLAAIYGDDRLLARTLQLLSKLNLRGELALRVYNLLTMRLRFFQDQSLKNYHNGTIGHCTAKNALNLQSSLFELLTLLSKLLEHGITPAQLRSLLESPIADIASENMKDFIYKHYVALPTETRELFDRIQYLTTQDAAMRHYDATTPVAVVRPIVYQAPMVQDPLSSWRPQPQMPLPVMISEGVAVRVRPGFATTPGVHREPEACFVHVGVPGDEMTRGTFTFT